MSRRGQALEDLLFAYLHIGRVRNDTNHANTGSGDNGSLFPDEKDVSVKLVQIQESIRYFIESYDTVLNQIAGKKPVVVRINADEVKAAARRIERAEKERAEKENRDGQNTD